MNRDLKKIVRILTILLILFLGYSNQDVIKEKTGQISEPILNLNFNSEFKFSEKKVILNTSQNISEDVVVEFCPSKNCFSLVNTALSEAKIQIKCAFYDLGEENIARTLLNKSNSGIDVSLVIDNLYLKENALKLLSGSKIKITSDTNRNTKYNNYMHNKFCIIDGKTVLTGSTNPTFNGFYKNNNNLLKIKSKYLAKNYENEFDQVSAGIFGTNKQSTLEYNNISMNFDNQTYIISSFMCPQDDCEGEVLKVLNKAEREIIFANFVLTLNSFEKKLVEKSKSGVLVRGVVETRNRNSKGSEIGFLNQSFEIRLDKNKNNMHNKFFVVDERYLITGSMNPSSSGVNYNDENILIIDNEKLAKMFKEEFLRII